jgi:hypothetical protein
MNTILFLICFMLIFILFYLVIILFQKVTRINEIEKKQSEVLKEIEDVLTSYIMEIKEENDTFLMKMVNTSQAEPITDREKDMENSTISIRENEISDEDLKELLPLAKNEEILTSTIINEKLDTNESLLSKVVSLDQQGMSVEDIAKKLNKGKTEIELLLKFRRK